MSRQKSFLPSGFLVRSTLILALTLIPITGALFASVYAQTRRPDLIVRINGPAMASVGDNIGPMVNTLARNIGAAPAPGTTGTLDPPNGFMIDVVLSTDMNVPPGFANFSPNFSEDVLLQGGRISNTTDLAPATSKNYPNLQGGSGKIPIDTPTGNYFLCARIDAGSKVAESNEGNNVACTRIRIMGPKRPDLVVRLNAPARAVSGSNIGPLVRVRASNIGGSTAPGTTGTLDPPNGYMIDLVLSTDTNVPASFATFSPNFSEDVLLQGGRISNTLDLAPGASRLYPTGAGIPADTPTGMYHLCARIDSGNKVSESNEGNNLTCVRIRIVRP
jgi:hypothetical protein